jgi:hypothetical protein
MILGDESDDRAPTSSSATGCTFNSTPYRYDLSGHNFVLWDTAGLNEGDQGTVTLTNALKSLYALLKSLEGGVSLLVFCMRGPRINDTAQKNWQLFHEIICQKEVPIAMAVTYLENEEPMDAWWPENENRFRGYGMNPCGEHGSGVACITASKGKLRRGRYHLQDEYDESQEKIRRLIIANSLETPWRVHPLQWFRTVVSTAVKTDCWGNVVEEIRNEEQVEVPVADELVSRWGISPEMARAFEGH